MPRACAAHGEAAQHDFLVVDFVAGFHGIDGLEDVGFPGPSIGIVAASVDIEGDEILTGGGGFIVLMRGDETDFRELFAASRAAPRRGAQASSRRRNSG